MAKQHRKMDKLGVCLAWHASRRNVMQDTSRSRRVFMLVCGIAVFCGVLALCGVLREFF